MSNHSAGNWFISVFKMRFMSAEELKHISENKNYRYTTRRNAQNSINLRLFNKVN